MEIKRTENNQVPVSSIGEGKANCFAEEGEWTAGLESLRNHKPVEQSLQALEMLA